MSKYIFKETTETKSSIMWVAFVSYVSLMWVCVCKVPLHPRLIIVIDDMANPLTTRRILTFFSRGISEFEKKESVYEQLILVSNVCSSTWKCS